MPTCTQALAHLNYSPLAGLQFRGRICKNQNCQWRCIKSGENEKQDNSLVITAMPI